MSGVTQKIRRFTGGMSDQPDEMKLPGQVREALNCTPDVVYGLLKRPGTNLIPWLDPDGTASSVPIIDEGKWFWINKNEPSGNDQRYLGHIDHRRFIGEPVEENLNPEAGKVRIWDLDTGREQNVIYADVVDNTKSLFSSMSRRSAGTYNNYSQTNYPSYFSANVSISDDLQDLTVNDYTFITNRQKQVSMTQSAAVSRQPEGFYELRTLAGATTYNIRFFDVEPEIIGEIFKVEKSPKGRVPYSTVGGPPPPDGWLNPDNYPKTSEELERWQFGSHQTSGSGAKYQITQDINYVWVNGAWTIKIDDTITLLEGGSGYAVGDTEQILWNDWVWEVEVKEIADSNERVEIFEATFVTPNSGVVAKDILEALADQINQTKYVNSSGNLVDWPDGSQNDDGQDKLEGDFAFEAEVIGNGIHFTRPINFAIDVNNGSLSRVLSPTKYTVDEQFTVDDSQDPPVVTPIDFYIATAANYTELPTQCKHNLIALVGNSIDVDEDDTYRIFVGDNAVDGPGVWDETFKPGLPTTFNSVDMPHVIVKLSAQSDYDDIPLAKQLNDENGQEVFLAGPTKWIPREVGDEITVPRPSFAPPQGQIIEGGYINQVLFYRNRLVFLTGESIVMSRTVDPFDFWAATASTISPGDTIDLDVSSNDPATLYNAVENNTGLILFAERAQYLLSNGDVGALTPSTAQISQLSTYNFNRNSDPISLGTTTGFVADQGKYTRFYEMASIRREGEPDVVEQSKVIERLLPQEMNMVTVSKENDMVALTHKGTDEVWLFRFFDTGEQRQQSSWFKWKFHGEVVSHKMIYDSYYLVLKKNDGVYLVRCDLRAIGEPTNTFTYDTNDYKNIEGDDYRFFVEYGDVFEETSKVEKTRMVKGGDQDGETYTASTTFDISSYPVFTDLKDKLIALDLSVNEDENGKYQGKILVPEISDDNTSITLPGEFPAGIALGYNYEMKVTMPQFYITKAVNQNSTESLDSANLIVHRIKMNLGQIGYYETTLKRLGRNDYTQVYEAKPMDLYQADELGWMPDYEQTTPIYQRNKTFNLIIKSEHPSPAALYSATLEGVYTENYYRRS